jgi:hypothetical protein
MEMSKLEIVGFANGINTAQSMPDKYDEHFTYSLSRNKRGIKDQFECIQETQKTILKEYHEELKALSEKYCDRNDGKPVSENGQYVFTENLVAFSDAKNVLDAKHKDTLDKYKAIMAEKETVNVFIHKHPFPPLHGDIADLLFPMREEPKEGK